MLTARRRNLTAAAIALAVVAAGGTTANAAPHAGLAPTVQPAEPVDFKIVTTVENAGTAGLARSVAIRVADPDDLARLERVFDEAPTDVTHRTEPGETPTGEVVLDAIEKAYPAAIPSDSVLLVGLVSGCSPSPGVVRLADGEVVLVDAGSDPNVNCAVAHTIIAVVEVAADDVPVGGADRATLRQFEFVGHEPDLPASDTELPPVADGDRRITTIVSGCQDTTAELVVSESAVEAVAKNEHGEPDYDCAQAEWFVATFDISAGLIPATAELPS